MLLHPPHLIAMNAWKEGGYVKQLEQDFRLVMIEPLGQGLSDAPEDASHYTISSRIRHILDILREIQADYTFFLGMGLGAQVGFQMAKEFPRRIRSLISMAAQPYQELEETKYLKEKLEQLRSGNIATYLQQWHSLDHLSDAQEKFIQQGNSEADGQIKQFNEKLEEIEKQIKNEVNKVTPIREKNIENLSKIQRLNLELKNLDEESDRIRGEIENIKSSLKTIDGLSINCTGGSHLANILSITIDDIDNEALIASCPDLAFSAGSACSSSTMAPSHVLQAIGLSGEQANSTIRLSLGRFTTEADIDAAAAQLQQQIKLDTQSGNNTSALRLNFWSRLFQPLMTLIMVFIAIPFIFGPLRSVSIGLRLLSGITVGLIFYIMNQFVASFGLAYQIQPVIASISLPALFFLFGLFLFWWKK